MIGFRELNRCCDIINLETHSGIAACRAIGGCRIKLKHSLSQFAGQVFWPAPMLVLHEGQSETLIERARSLQIGTAQHDEIESR